MLKEITGQNGIIKKLLKKKVVNFMVVGGIGYVINMAIYYPLINVFKDKVDILRQQFYIIPFLLSSLIAIICNYYLNKLFTFKDSRENSLGGIRYLFMALATLVLDVFVLFLFVQYCHLPPILGAALAILLVFVLRFFIAKSWVWHNGD